MAYTLPNQMPVGLEPLMKGFSTGANFYNMLMEQARAREASKRAQEMQPFNIKHLLAQTEGLQGANSRANQLLSPQLQALKDAHERAMRQADPDYEIKQFMHTMHALGQLGNNVVPNNPPANLDTSNAKMPDQELMDQGQGMFPVQGQPNPDMQQPKQLQEPMQNGQLNNPSMQQPMQLNNQNTMGMDLNNLNPLQKMFLANSKFKGLLNESPEQKRLGQLEVNQEKLKQKEQFESNKEQRKDIKAATNDIPHLKQALESVRKMKQIAETNPKLWGHYVAPDLWAKTTKEKDAGTFQNLLADQIAGLESKLSSKGNIVALKIAANLKPSFAEQQPVVLGKLESMEKQLQNALSESMAKSSGINKLNNDTSENDPLGLFGE